MIIYRFLFSALVTIFIFACTNNEKTASADDELNQPDTAQRLLTKPPARVKDTLIITDKAAVFYHPDSLQLTQIKAKTDSGVFDGTMHEFFYQMRNGRIVIKKIWPELKIIEAKNYRYLLFIKEDNTHDLVDLDTKKDAYGLFVFNKIKPPLLIDMTNIETDVSFYLK